MAIQKINKIKWRATYSDNTDIKVIGAFSGYIFKMTGYVEVSVLRESFP